MAQSLERGEVETGTPQDDALIARYLGPHPSNRGLAEYWLMEPGIPVWAVIGQWKAEAEDVDETAAAYHISREAVEAALAFYAHHRPLIDDRLSQNEAA